MFLSKWENLPAYMQNEKVRVYYNILEKKKKSLVAKRVLDIVVSSVLIVLLLAPMCVIAAVVKCGSKGPVLFQQKRITTNAGRLRF